MYGDTQPRAQRPALGLEIWFWFLFACFLLSAKLWSESMEPLPPNVHCGLGATMMIFFLFGLHAFGFLAAGGVGAFALRVRPRRALRFFALAAAFAGLPAMLVLLDAL